MCVGNTTQQEAVIEEEARQGEGGLSRGLSLNRDTTLHGLKFLPPPPPPPLVDTVGSRGQGEGGRGRPGLWGVELGYTV